MIFSLWSSITPFFLIAALIAYVRSSSLRVIQCRRRTSSFSTTPRGKDNHILLSSTATLSPSLPRSSISSNKPPPNLPLQNRLAAGGASRALTQFLIYPIDALRTLAQTRDHRTLADVGATALVRGCATTSSFGLFIGSIQFGIFGATRAFCGPVVASALGAAVSCLVSVPQEVIKQRIVTGIHSGFREACVMIYRKDGITGFYSAWRPTVANNVPFVVSTFSANDFMKQRILVAKRRRQEADESSLSSNELTIAENVAVGVVSALIGALITHPADVVKTRMMTQASSRQVPYSSTMDCVRTMYEKEGMKPFYSGFLQRSFYMGPLWSIQFAINGRICKSLEQWNKEGRVVRKD